jgi:hypothetical protein
MHNAALFPESNSARRSPVAACWSHRFLPILTAAAAFLIDLNTPNGIADGFLYVAAVLVCVWAPAAHYAIYTALGLMLPMILGFVWSPDGASVEVAAITRCVALTLIWLVAIAVWRKARERDSTLRALQQQLQDVEHAAELERMALSDWLCRDLRPELTMVDWRLNYLSRQRRRGAEVQSEALVLRRAIRRASESVYGKMIRLREANIWHGAAHDA